MNIVEGNLLDALLEKKVDVLAHGCNCSNGFASGIAGEIARRFPRVKEEFHDNHHDGFDDLGNVDVISINYEEDDFPAVANCYTQQRYGRDGKLYLSYEGLQMCLEELAKISAKYDILVGLPKIGCGLAGGDWRVVGNMIEDTFNEFKGKYVVYVLEK